MGIRKQFTPELKWAVQLVESGSSDLVQEGQGIPG